MEIYLARISWRLASNAVYAAASKLILLDIFPGSDDARECPYQHFMCVDTERLLEKAKTRIAELESHLADNGKGS